MILYQKAIDIRDAFDILAFCILLGNGNKPAVSKIYRASTISDVTQNVRAFSSPIVSISAATI